MNNFSFSRATHFSLVWAVTLVIVTMVEWRGLDRDPLGQDIFSPFISRTVAIAVGGAPREPDIQFEEELPLTDSQGKELQYEVEIKFNGPLFLVCFFVPVLLFHGISLLITRLRQTKR